MVHKLANALKIDPTELFYKEINTETVIWRNTQIEDIDETVNQLIADFFVEKVQKPGEEIGEKSN
jgi:hypothetical protein